MKDKKGITITNTFQQILDESICKGNKIWVDKSSKFYNRSMKSRSQDDDTEIYSKYNKGKSVVSEKFIRAIKNKIYKYTILVSKNLYIDKLDEIVNKYSKTYGTTIKIKSVDAKSSTYIDFHKENKRKILNLKLVTM